MNSWIQIKGTIQKGHGVASGKSGDPRFPEGTIAMQTPFFSDLGLKLEQCFSVKHQPKNIYKQHMP
jgi:hypothetical protein